MTQDNGGKGQDDWLIIDCAGPRLLVARIVSGEVTGAHTSDELRGQAEQLNKAIEALGTERPLNKLTKIVVNRGPGSFTGVRVALATAYGLKLGLGERVSLHPINAFAVHQLSRPEGPRQIVLESRRVEKYCLVDGDMSVQPVEDNSPLKRAGFATDIAALEGTSGASFTLLSAEDYARAIASGHRAEPFSALYVRPPDVGPQISQGPATK